MSLFSSRDLLLLAKKNLGLRLTSNPAESSTGGIGDAVPISHLAGADDIIEFISLAFLPELPWEKMETIYNRYKENDIGSYDCMPRLILYYAARHDIGDARERLSYQLDNQIIRPYSETQLAGIDSEAKEFVNFYTTVGFACPLELVVDRYPHLTHELADNFNEKLRLRLKINWHVYMTDKNMYYLFLTPNGLPGALDYNFGGRDFNHYPLGKVGRHNFKAANIVAQVKVVPSIDSEQNLERHIFELINGILHDELPQLNLGEDDATWCDCARCSVM